MDYQLKEILYIISKEVNQSRDEALAKLEQQRECEIQKAEAAYDGAYRAVELMEKLLESKNAEIAALKQEFDHLKKNKESHIE